MSTYLIPASQENIRATINKGVPIDVGKRLLRPHDFEGLSKALGDEKSFYCWAMTEGKRPVWESMRPGDHVILTLRGTGLFNYVAEVIFKAESRELGEHLWSYVPNDPWKLIYFLSDIRPISVRKSSLLSALGYDPSGHVAGAQRVTGEHTRPLQRYPSVHEFLAALEGPARLQCEDPNEPLPKYLADNEALEKYLADIEVPEFKHEAVSPEAPKFVPPDWLRKAINELEVLLKDGDHKERAHESVVESFYESLGYKKHEEIRFRHGRMDVCIYSDETPLIINEVKRHWNLSGSDRKTRGQAYNYALEHNVRFVVITNGDYFGVYDRNQGTSYESNFVGEFRLSELTPSGLQLIQILKK